MSGRPVRLQDNIKVLVIRDPNSLRDSFEHCMSFYLDMAISTGDSSGADSELDMHRMLEMQVMLEEGYAGDVFWECWMCR